MSDVPSPLTVGTLVGGTYETVRLLGVGGMGEVWLAKHLRLPGKHVAIKVLRTGGALGGEVLARFRREAEVATRIGHPNIVEVHDFNTLQTGEPYLVLEYLQGESLAARLSRGLPTLEEASSIVRQVGSALAASHALGVIHRDLKPDNIFLVPSPLGTVVKVLDFGISKIRDSSTVQTQQSALLGTPQYMAPEQALGDNQKVGPWTDVWALGSIAYEMLAGEPPFGADSVARVVFKVAYEPHVPLAQRPRADVPPRMVQAVEGALLKVPEQRIQDMRSFVALFTGEPLTLPNVAVEGASGVARPGSATDAEALAATFAKTPSPAAEPLAAPAPRRGLSPVALAGALLGLALVAASAFLASRLPEKAPPAPVLTAPAAPVAEPVLAPAPVVEPVAEREPAVPAPAVEPEPVAPAPRKPAPRAVVLTDAERALLSELEGLIKAERWDDALKAATRVQRKLGDSPAAQGVAALNELKALCAVKDRAALQRPLNQLYNAAQRAEATHFCQRHGVHLADVR